MITDNGIGATTVVTSGSGTWVLTGTASAFSGGIQVLGGMLQFATDSAMPANAVITFAGGVLQYNAANTQMFLNRFSTQPGQAYAIDTNGLALTFPTALTGAGNTFRKLGAGTLTLNAANTYTGDTTVAAGTLR